MSLRFSHKVDTFFCKHEDNLFASIFADSGLSCKWWWKRCEYQKIHTVHIQGYYCLDCDLDIIKSTEMVLKACVAELCINKYKGWEFITDKRISSPKIVCILMNELVTNN